MLKIGNLKSGDIITVNDEEIMREGTVVSVSHEENQALVNNGVQEFWYSPEEMYALVTDVAAYPQFLPWCDHASVVAEDAKGMTEAITTLLNGDALRAGSLLRLGIETRDRGISKTMARKGPAARLEGSSLARRLSGDE